MLWAGAVWILGSLITLVMAVILTVAFPLAGAQATPVGAAELVGATGGILTLRGLVRAIGTVTIVVAHKMLGDAQTVLAHELTVVTGAVVQAAS